MSGVALVALGLAACDPPPPRAVLTVTTTANGPDTDPGDGACLAAGGGCSLQAALEEANHAPDGADVVVPAGSYGGFDATITGDIRINPTLQPGVIITNVTFTAAAGAHLEVHGVNTSTADVLGDDLLDVDVVGTAVLARSVVERVKVDAGGVLGLIDTVVVAFSTPSAEISGGLLALRSTLLAHDVDGSATEAVLHTAPGATSHLVSSAIAQPDLESDTGTTFAGGVGTCTGAPPTLASSSVAEVPAPCGGAGDGAPARVEYSAELGTGAQTGFELSVRPTSPLVDAIPLGDPACDTSTVDVFGNPRGVDGDGDGVGGCDVGAIERPTPTTTPLVLGGPGNTFGGTDADHWAMILGPGADATFGDDINTRCLTQRDANPCTTGANPGYLPPTDPDAGMWYVIEPPAAGGEVTVSIYDAQFTPGNALEGTGDRILAPSPGIATSYRLYRQNDPTDFDARTAVGPSTPSNSAGSCHWSVTGDAAFDDAWVSLCTIDMEAGDVYLLNVRTSERPGYASSAAANGYAVQACTDGNCATPGQPIVRARERGVFAPVIQGTDATIYLAEVGPQHAGSTLVVEMWDPADSTATTLISPRMPSATQPGPSRPVPTSACEITSSRPGLPQAGDLGSSECSYLASPGGTPYYNGHLVTMRIDIPSTYTCTTGVDPTTSADSCWWGLRYEVSSVTVDITTWRAHIVGDPLPLDP